MFTITSVLRRFARHRVKTLNRTTSAALQADQLRRLVSVTQNTRFGRDHGFADIRTVEDYQTAVPLRDYDAFHAEYWSGDFPLLVNETWPGQIPLYATTSGTSGSAPKRIPVSKAMLKANRRAAIETVVWHLASRPDSKVFEGQTFTFGASATLDPLAQDVHEGYISGIITARMPWWLARRAYPPKDLAGIVDWDERISAIVQGSLSADVRTLGGMPSWLVVLLNDVLEAGNAGTLKEIWPNLSLLIYGGIPFEPYRPTFNRWLEDLDVDEREIYMASEGFLGTSDLTPADGIRLNLDTGFFFEFVPVEDIGSDSPHRFWAGNVETDVDYAIVLTTCAGLWSYVIGDVVRLPSADPLRVHIHGRVDQGLSAFGEHVMARELDLAIAEAAKAINTAVHDYTVAAVHDTGGTMGHHVYFVETEHPLPDPQRKTFAKTLDSALQRINNRYSLRRNSVRGVGAPEFVFAESGSFNAWMKAKDKLGGQHKVPRILSDNVISTELRTWLERETSTPQGTPQG